MKPDLSILICTRNGIRTIAEAISCCEKEILSSGKNVEIIVVDNGSTDGTYEHVQKKSLSSKITLRLHREQKPGKIYAFELGIKEANADLVSIIDDDNFINTNFVNYTLQFFKDYSDVGVIGSQNRLDESISPPDWFKWARGRFACSQPIIDSHKMTDQEFREVGSIGVVAGAGMTFAKKPLLEAIACGYRFYNDTQRGTGMSVTGEDVELCWLMRSMGYKFGYDPRIKLTHSINPDRLNLKSFYKLCTTIGAGSLGYDPFMFTDIGKKWCVKYTWQWQLVSKAKRIISSYIKNEFALRDREEVAFRIRILRLEANAAILRILKDRGRYTKHINCVAFGEWTKLRVK